MGLPSPRASRHPVDVGTRSEAAVLAELVRRGYHVLVPFGSNHRYDFVLDLDGRFVRLQCKTGRLRRGCIEFATRSIRSNTKGVRFRDYHDEIDMFVVDCPRTAASMSSRSRTPSRPWVGFDSTRPATDR